MRIVGAGTRFVRRAIDLLLLVLIAAVLAAVVLARAVPVLTDGVTLVVGGGSMEPVIPVGSAVLVQPTPADALAVGDIVSVQVGPTNAIFTHRIVRFADLPSGRHIETKGDANETPDPALVPVSAVIGRAVLTVPYAGYLITLLTLPEGVVFLLGIAGSLFAAAWLLESLELDERAAKRRRDSGAEASAGPLAASTASAEAAAVERETVLVLTYGEPIARRPAPAPPLWLDPPAGPGEAAWPWTGARPWPPSGTIGERVASIREHRGRGIRRLGEHPVGTT